MKNILSFSFLLLGLSSLAQESLTKLFREAPQYTGIYHLTLGGHFVKNPGVIVCASNIKVRIDSAWMEGDIYQLNGRVIDVEGEEVYSPESSIEIVQTVEGRISDLHELSKLDSTGNFQLAIPDSMDYSIVVFHTDRYYNEVALDLRSVNFFKYHFPITYRLKLPSQPTRYFIETIPMDTGSSYSAWLDTLNYQVEVEILDRMGEIPFSEVTVRSNVDRGVLQRILLDFDGRSVLHLNPKASLIEIVHEGEKLLEVNLIPGDGELPVKLVVFTDDFRFLIPILHCKERISTDQMREAYRAIEKHERPEVEKCGLCQLGFEI